MSTKLTKEEIASEFENRIACIMHPQPHMSGRQINRLHGQQRRHVEDLARDIATALREERAKTVEEVCEALDCMADEADVFAITCDPDDTGMHRAQEAAFKRASEVIRQALSTKQKERP